MKFNFKIQRFHTDAVSPDFEMETGTDKTCVFIKKYINYLVLEVLSSGGKCLTNLSCHSRVPEPCDTTGEPGWQRSSGCLFLCIYRGSIPYLRHQIDGEIRFNIAALDLGYFLCQRPGHS